MSGFREITMGDLLRETVSRFPENEALICPEFGVRETYDEFLISCTEVAKGFLAIGVEKGDHVSVWATNVPQWLHLQFSLGMIGAVLVTVNTNYKSHELEYILNQSDSTTLVHIEGIQGHKLLADSGGDYTGGGRRRCGRDTIGQGSPL